MQQGGWSLPEQDKKKEFKDQNGTFALVCSQAKVLWARASDCCVWLGWSGQAVVEECLQGDWAAWETMALGSCLDTSVLDLNFRSVFVLHNTESALLLCSSLVPSWVTPKGYIHWESFNVLKLTELSLSRFWPMSLEAAQPWRKYCSDWGLYWWDFATSLAKSDPKLSFGPCPYHACKFQVFSRFYHS